MGLQKYRADYAGAVMPNDSIPWFSKWVGGPSLAVIRNCPVLNMYDASPRTVYAKGDANTFFTIPAVCKYKTKTIKGHITVSDDGYVFTASHSLI
jgi:hypothetical protein